MIYPLINQFNCRARQIFGVLKYFMSRIVYGSALAARGLSLFYPGSKLEIQNDGNIVLHGKTKLERGSRLESRGNLEIGMNFTLNQYSRVIAHDQISIGDNVLIAQFVSILDHDHAVQDNVEGHDRWLSFQEYSTAPISIGSNVWIGDKVTILKGVTIGSNVVIGANSVVTSDIPDFSVAAGAPAKIIKRL